MTDEAKLKTAIHALAHLTECTLATVETLRELKRPPKAELHRQQKIANYGVDALRTIGITSESLHVRYGCSRTRKLLEKSPLEQLAQVAD